MRRWGTGRVHQRPDQRQRGLLSRDGAAPGASRLRIELCTVYWHYLLIVWLVLFGLLLVT